MNSYRIFRRIGQLSVVLVAGIFAMALFPAVKESASAAEGDLQGSSGAQVSFEMKPMLKIVLLGGDVDFNIKPTPTGATDSVTRTVQIETNYAAWYDMYLSVENNRDNSEYAHLFNTKTDVVQTIAPVTANKTLTDFEKNTWGYALGQSIDKETIAYNPIPAAATTPIKAVKTGGEAATDVYDLAYGAKVATNLTSGQYTNRVNVSVIAGVTPKERGLTIIYQKADGSTAAPTYNGVVPIGETYSVASPPVAGYTPNQATVSGTMGEEEVTITVTYTKNAPTKLTELENMQQMTNAICNASNVNDTKSGVVDLRDSNTYSVAKLADGKCWMTSNLNLKLNADTLPLKGTSADGKTSDVPGEWNPGSSWYTVNGISSNDSDTGTLSWNTGNGHGTYYQFNAATAGQGNSVTGSGANTTQSVCPSGWRLPTSGNGTGEFRALMSAFGASFNGNSVTNVGTVLPKLMGAPANFTYSGYVNNGSLYSVGSEGRYWSSTSYSSTNAYYLYFNSSYIYPSSDSGNRRNGFSVRCVAR